MNPLLLVALAGGGLFLFTRRNANGGVERRGNDPEGRPGRSTPPPTSGTPSPPRSGVGSTRRLKLRTSAIATARTGIVSGTGGTALVYNGIRVDMQDNMQVYLLLKKQGTSGPTITEVKVSNPPPPYLREKLAEYLIKQAEKQFRELPEKAKCEAAERLNGELAKHGVDAGITCEDSVEEAINKAVVASAAAGATAACVASGAGAPLASLCGTAGAWLASYIGPKIGEWLEGAWDDVEEFFSDIADSKYAPWNW